MSRCWTPYWSCIQGITGHDVTGTSSIYEYRWINSSTTVFTQSSSQSIHRWLHPCKSMQIKSTSAESHWWRIFGPKRRRRTESPCPFAEDQSLARSYLGYKQHPTNWRWKPFSTTIGKLSYSWVDPKRHPTYHKRQRSTPPWLPCHKNTRRSSPWCCRCTTRPQASDKTSLYLPKRRLFGSIPMVQSPDHVFFRPTCKTALFGVFDCESIPNTVLVQ